MTDDVGRIAAKVSDAVRAASAGLIEREAVVQLIALAAVAREHVLIIGPPGTAKSEAVRRFARAVHGRYFEYLLGRFTEPSEIFGPVDLRKLREGTVETETRGMLPEAEIAFLDEVFLGSTAILNTLLGLLNERRFRRGHTIMECPLQVCVGASNDLPDDPALGAFADRFLVHVFIDPVPDGRLEDLLTAGWALESRELATAATAADLNALSEEVRRASLDGVQDELAHAVRLLRRAGVDLSDRRIVKAQRVIAAAAMLAGRSRPTSADLWPLVYVVPTRAGQEIARDTLLALLTSSESGALGDAAEAASASPAARAARIIQLGDALLAAAPGEDGEERERWLLRLEGLAREIDAGFLPEMRPDGLDALRRRIVALIQAPTEP